MALPAGEDICVQYHNAMERWRQLLVILFQCTFPSSNLPTEGWATHVAFALLHRLPANTDSNIIIIKLTHKLWPQVRYAQITDNDFKRAPVASCKNEVNSLLHDGESSGEA